MERGGRSAQGILDEDTRQTRPSRASGGGMIARVHPPPHAYFVVSAVFHYLGPAFAVLLQLRFIRHEERLMSETFGEAYLSYRARTRRWI